MARLRRYKNIVEKFLSGDSGQRFFNFAYSIGAAVVILGALFKILHLAGGNTLLTIGMGTEVLMFILTAFDRPAREYKWEEVFPVLDSHDEEDRPLFTGGGAGASIGGATQEDIEEAYNAAGVSMSNGTVGTVIVGGNGIAGLSPDESQSLSESISKMNSAAEQLSHMAEMTDATANYLTQLNAISAQMEQLRATTETLNQVSQSLASSYSSSVNDETTASANSASSYIEQMENLNRNIGGLNTIYEIQLRSISTQLESIESVNRGLKDIRDMYEKAARESISYCTETEKMAHNMKQLNSIYEKMLRAMTINMYNPGSLTGLGVAPDPQPQAPQQQPPVAPSAPAPTQEPEPAPAQSAKPTIEEILSRLNNR